MLTDRASLDGLTLLTRLAQQRSGKGGERWLRRAISNERLELLAESAIEVAVETGDPIGRVLAAALLDRYPRAIYLSARLTMVCDRGDLAQVESLWELAVVASRTMFDSASRDWLDPTPSQQFQLARLATNLATRFGQIRLDDEALDFADQGMTRYRRLFEDQPEENRSGLAFSLHVLGVRLSAVGRSAQALEAFREAVAHRRILCDDEAGPIQAADLSHSLESCALAQAALGLLDEALATAEEALAIAKRLADREPKKYLGTVAFRLCNMASLLAQVDRNQEAHVASSEATEIFDRLVAQGLPGLRLDLARSLANLANLENRIGRSTSALPLITRALRLLREASCLRRRAFEVELASALQVQGEAFQELGRWDDAVRSTQEAVEIYRALEQAEPGRFGRELAVSLKRLTDQASMLGDSSKASATEEERRLLTRARIAALVPGILDPKT
jgi:tetratricopeptide (TPR) repeat protein